jgi:arginyl-tRNA synthetase
MKLFGVVEGIKNKKKFVIQSHSLQKREKINIEFISANPTGPLTLGNGRGGFGGDVLANVLTKAGYKVSREYYINDTGAQITKLGHSVIGDNEAVYKGEYINKLRKEMQEFFSFFSCYLIGLRGGKNISCI